MEPAGTAGQKTHHHGNRVVTEDGLPRVVSLQQPDTVAAAEVDRRPEFHRTVSAVGVVSHGR